jgi:pimeloyl-ACP methyl ester carboxylesterase
MRILKCKINDLSVYYEVHGEGKPAIFFHGWNLDHRDEVKVFEPIFKNRKGWKRIYIDLPGRGLTPGSNWIKNQDDILKVSIDFIDQVIPKQHFIVVGTSAGALIARGLVYHRFNWIDGVLLRVPVIIANHAKRAKPKNRVLIKDKKFVEKLSPQKAKDFSGLIIQDQNYLDKIISINKEIISPAQELADNDFLTRIQENPENYGFSFKVDELFKPFLAPSLIITGRQDVSVGYSDAWKLIDKYSRATYVALDRAQHIIPIQQVLLFQALVNEWLDRVEEYINAR